LKSCPKGDELEVMDGMSKKFFLLSTETNIVFDIEFSTVLDGMKTKYGP